MATDSRLDERDWELLLQRIADGKCTPLVGPGVSSSFMPLRTDIAQNWAHEHDYPLVDSGDLARVAQYLAVKFDPYFPKETLQRQIGSTSLPDFTAPNQPHAVLASLDLPIYVTTNYDNFMVEALKHRKKDPKVELCRWNSALKRSQISVLESGYEPTPANPLVYHLNGHCEVLESLVVTEDDYLDFLVNISNAEFQLPSRIQRALVGASLLFIGYNPTDWDFRVLFRGLVAATDASLRRISVTVQLPPVPTDTPAPTLQKVREYLSEYFDLADRHLRVYWGTVEEFMTELNQRWQGKHSPGSRDAAGGDKAPLIDLIRLHRNLVGHFNRDELRTLAFELRVDYENLPEAKEGFARDLIVYLQHRKRLHELVEAGRRWRPEVTW
ncbi:MAG: SIR2 family protein [Chloroflexi bacterium]|nr:SIR2 family protein [Chloroflexota bacterium]MCI0579089.1 SIR2 family protein [Chloroflexota bacterium]MCI0650089.1 SIR2 family protein [Chloroflexota bacterium]MCI0728285.1 SIR2 family protein [Chloroflexota bacterium]